MVVLWKGVGVMSGIFHEKKLITIEDHVAHDPFKGRGVEAGKVGVLRELDREPFVDSRL